MYDLCLKFLKTMCIKYDGHKIKKSSYYHAQISFYRASTASEEKNPSFYNMIITMGDSDRKQEYKHGLPNTVLSFSFWPECSAELKDAISTIFKIIICNTK